MKHKKPVTIKDVAVKSNVSISTVSRVINNNPNVQTHIKETVVQAIEELQYEYKQEIVSNSIIRIGIVISDITNPFFATLLKGIDRKSVV